MTRPYLGIITSRGLESLVAETQHAMPFLLRRAYRRQPYKAICFWAVLFPLTAAHIHDLIASGQFLQALILLNVEAQDLGTIPPGYGDQQLQQTIAS